MCRSKGDPRGPYANGTFRCTLATRQTLKKQYDAAAVNKESHEANGNKRGVARMNAKMADIEAKEAMLPTQSTKGIIGNHSLEISGEEPIDLSFEREARRVEKENLKYSLEDAKAAEALAAQIERVNLEILRDKSSRSLDALKRDAKAAVSVISNSELKKRLVGNDEAYEAMREADFLSKIANLSADEQKAAKAEYKEAKAKRIETAAKKMANMSYEEAFIRKSIIRLELMFNTLIDLISSVQAKRDLDAFKKNIGANS
jgi:hypothetical protein